MQFAKEYNQIQEALRSNSELMATMISHIQTRPIVGKSTEGTGRTERLKEILIDLVRLNMLPPYAYAEVEKELPRSASIHASNNRVFPEGWGERLIRTQFSRFYNLAVLFTLSDNGIEICCVHHSSEESSNSKCTITMAGKRHSVSTMLNNMKESFENDKWGLDKLPHHPHCTHVFSPVDGQR